MSIARGEKNSMQPRADTSLKLAVGIDLGTTQTSVGISWDHRVIKILKNDFGSYTTPSVVQVNPDRYHVGEEAVLLHPDNLSNTIFHSKRVLGRSLDDPGVTLWKKTWSVHQLFRDPSDSRRVQLRLEMGLTGQRVYEFSMEDISALILGTMRKLVENQSNEVDLDVVITVPSHFNYLQRAATINAARIGGFDNVTLISEPIAAILTFMHQQQQQDGTLNTTNNQTASRNFLVIDLGGGTLDSMLVELSPENQMTVRAKVGDLNLGGCDFDEVLREYFIDEFSDLNCEVHLRQHKGAMVRLLQQCQFVKHQLTSGESAKLHIHHLVNEIPFHSEITRATFHMLARDLFARFERVIGAILLHVKYGVDQLDQVILAGGASRMPMIGEIVQRMVEPYGVKINRMLNIEEAITYGATYHAIDLLRGGGEQLVPTISYHIKTTLPQSIGIATKRNGYSILIPHATSLPARERLLYTTVEDYQDAANFELYEGDHPLANQNRLMGRFVLSGLTKMRAHDMRLEVIITIDEGHRIEVRATDLANRDNSEVLCLSEMERDALFPPDVVRTLRARLNDWPRLHRESHLTRRHVLTRLFDLMWNQS